MWRRERFACRGSAGVAISRLAAALVLCGAVLGCREAEPPPWTSMAVRGHHDAALLDDGRLIPLFASTRDPLGVCLRALPEVDTSRWQARIWWNTADRGELTDAATRMAGTVCFERELSRETLGRRLEACAEVVDAYDGSTWTAPCTTFEVLEDDDAYARLRRQLNQTLRADPPPPLRALEASLDGLSQEARDAGFPLLALRVQLVAAYYERTRGGSNGLENAARRLAGVPAWIDQSPATEWAAQVEQERFEIESRAEAPDGSRMWEQLRRAADLFLYTADSRRFTVAMQQANLLARIGAVSRAVVTLRTALDECSQAPCSGRLLGAARGNLAWLLITDPLAGETGWAEAEGILDELLASADGETDAFTRANRLLNRAYLRLRQGRPLDADLEQARALLATRATARARTLGSWADLLEGEAALDAAPGRALEHCGRALARASTARVAAWAAGCVAESHRRRGELERAASDFEQTLRLHEVASPANLDQELSIDVSRRAHDFYRAARVAVERGRPDEAWSLLERLDALSVGSDAPDCGTDTRTEPEAAQRERELSATLRQLELPASLERERQAEPVKELLRQELAALVRRRRCGQGAAAADPRLPGLRAVPLEEEILLLERDSSGAVRLARRAAVGRATVTRIAGEIGEAVRESGVDDDAWRRLTAPLAAALEPEPPVGKAPASDEPILVGYWLHGSLQGVPLAALPLAGPGPRWLGERVLPALYPADLRTRLAGREHAEGAPAAPRFTFVVDPSRNLPSGGRLAAFYRSIFPEARVLRGAEATSAAVEGALRSSTWLHVDAHGVYDPAFPELSHVVLADGELGLGALRDLSSTLEGANLLGCWTGAWPVTSDGGRHGLAGALARAGVPWTIASRTAVTDDLAADFNEAFYPALARGASVPAAYAEALALVRARRPASDWAAILLVAGGPRPDQGRSDGATENATGISSHS